jgi:outer membrane receptor for ferrienterochelin and colicin
MISIRIGQCLLGLCLVAVASKAGAQAQRLEIRGSALQQQAESLTGYSDAVERLPFSINLISPESFRDFGATSLSEVLRSDPAVSDAYNTLGYPENFAIRGMLIDHA